MIQKFLAQNDHHLNLACDSLLQSIRDSGLHFSCQETPWSIYETLRKSFIQTQSSTVTNLSGDSELKFPKSEFEKLSNKNKELKKALDITNSSLEHKVRECEDKDEVIDKANKNLSEKNDNLETMNKYFAVEKQKLEIKIGKFGDENLKLKREIAEDKSELKVTKKELKT